MTRRIVIGLSGGIDSAVSAYLLKKSGYEVIGVNFILNEGQDTTTAKKIAKAIGIKLIEIDLISLFREKIVKTFLREYSLGRTPNPCALCNKYVKFPELYKQASLLNADKIATGHYAIIRDKPFGLFKGKDPKKDQSYFLSLVEAKVLKKTIFPVGNLTKDKVREIAREINVERFVSFKGSQDICFVNGSFRKFIRENLKDRLKRGIIRDIYGRKLGEHEGISFYTVGQRRRLNVATGKRQYIVRLDPLKNEIIVGGYEDLLKEKFTIREVNWISDRKEILEGEVKIRYHTPPSRARLVLVKEGEAEVYLYSPLSAIAPGQVATFYVGDQVICGGIIA